MASHGGVLGIHFIVRSSIKNIWHLQLYKRVLPGKSFAYSGFKQRFVGTGKWKSVELEYSAT